MLTTKEWHTVRKLLDKADDTEKNLLAAKLRAVRFHNDI